MKRVRKMTAFHYEDDDYKIQFADSIECVVCQYKHDGSFEKVLCYCWTEEDADFIVNELNRSNSLNRKR